MKIVIISVGSFGDIHPLFQIGRRLKHEGHDVVIFMNENYRTIITQAGFRFESILSADDACGWHAHFQRSSLRYNLREFSHYIVAKAGFIINQKIAAEYTPGDTLLIAVSGAILGSLIAHERFAIPLVSVYLAPYMIKSNKNPPRVSNINFTHYLPAALVSFIYDGIERKYVDNIVGKAFNELRARFALPPIQCLHDYHYRAASLILTLAPRWFANRTENLPAQLKFVGFPFIQEQHVQPLSHKLTAFLAGDDKPIVFTFGTENREAKPLFAESIQACVRLKRKGIFLSRHSRNIPALLPDFICHLDYVPLEALLPHCAAIVHHAGSGTLAQGLVAGIPQLSVPHCLDQFDNAYCLKKLGVADEILRHKYRAKTVARKLSRLLATARITENVQRIKEKVISSTPLDTMYKHMQSFINVKGINR